MKSPTGPRGRSIAIIGAGPRGTSVLERIAAGAEQPVRVHVVDPYPPGGGRIWATDQPEHLLMNTFAADATIFTDDTLDCAGPVRPGPTLYEWARSGALPSDASDTLAAEAASLLPWSHPSRALQGRYLSWAFEQACTANELVTVTIHRTRALTCSTDPSGLLVIALEDGTTPLIADAVVIATGHTPLRPSAAEEVTQVEVDSAGLWYAPPSNPLDLDLHGVEAGEPLLCRGLGMNFFDAVSMLTIGRGGTFDGRPLRYRPSGGEPVLWVGSRRGLPYRAKGVFEGDPPAYPARWFDTVAIRRLMSLGRPVDFLADVWPLIAKDSAEAYYDVLARESPKVFAADPAALRVAFEQYAWDSPELEDVVDRTVPDRQHRLDFESLDRPMAGLTFTTPELAQDWIVSALAQDLSEANLGVRSPVKVASHVLGAARGPLRSMARYGGISGRSQATALAWFKGFAGSLASGPPATRIAQLLALAEEGLLHFLGPDMVVEIDHRRFAAGSPAVAAPPVRARALLEARLPGTDVARSAEPLLQSLVATGAARNYVIQDGDGSTWTSGAVEVTRAPYNVVRRDGVPHNRCFAVGIPVEGVHWGTQLGAIARSNSLFLRDTDAVARAALLCCDAASIQNERSA